MGSRYGRAHKLRHVNRISKLEGQISLLNERVFHLKTAESQLVRLASIIPNESLAAILVKAENKELKSTIKRSREKKWHDTGMRFNPATRRWIVPHERSATAMNSLELKLTRMKRISELETRVLVRKKRVAHLETAEVQLVRLVQLIPNDELAIILVKAEDNKLESTIKKSLVSQFNKATRIDALKESPGLYEFLHKWNS